MDIERFIDTPLFYDGEIINQFIPQEYKGLTRVLEEKEWVPDFNNLSDKLDEVLAKPLGFDVSLEQLIEKYYGTHHKILVLVDDNTRPNVHTKLLLPLLLPRLTKYGVTKADINIMFASGTHRPPNPDEQQIILGQKIWKEYQNQLLVHDCDNDCINLNTTSSMGTPILINKHVMNADLIIPVTDSEIHYMAGVAGTIKELIPGVVSRQTITKNHIKAFDKKLGFKKECRLGNVKGNPMITDLKEIASLILQKIPVFGIDAIFSLRSEEIVYLNAGDLVKLHEAAVQKVNSLRTVEIEVPADLVIISAKQLGINLYQSVKAIHTAWQAVKRDGTGKIIVLAACRDGVGSSVYTQAMEQCRNLPISRALDFVLENYCTEDTFKIGNQKLVDVFRILKSVGDSNVYMVSELKPDLLSGTFRISSIDKSPGENVSTTLKQMINTYNNRGEFPSIYIIPDPGILITQKN